MNKNNKLWRRSLLYFAFFTFYFIAPVTSVLALSPPLNPPKELSAPHGEYLQGQEIYEQIEKSEPDWDCVDYKLPSGTKLSLPNFLHAVETKSGIEYKIRTPFHSTSFKNDRRFNFEYMVRIYEDNTMAKQLDHQHSSSSLSGDMSDDKDVSEVGPNLSSYIRAQCLMVKDRSCPNNFTAQKRYTSISSNALQNITEYTNLRFDPADIWGGSYPGSQKVFHISYFSMTLSLKPDVVLDAAYSQESLGEPSPRLSVNNERRSNFIQTLTSIHKICKLGEN